MSSGGLAHQAGAEMSFFGSALGDRVLCGCAAVSCIAGLIVIWRFFRVKQLRRHPRSIIMSRSVADVIFCAQVRLASAPLA